VASRGDTARGYGPATVLRPVLVGTGVLVVVDLVVRAALGG
jgi:hypothetical protein